MFDRKELDNDKVEKANKQAEDQGLQKLALEFLDESDKAGYAFQWTWLNLPIIQMPADILAVQELIWNNKPDVIIETGIAWGGSILLSASILQLLGKGKVIGIDLNLYDHVEDQIMSYPFSDERIQLYKGSSTDPAIVEKVKSHIAPGDSVMIILDSNHTHEHVFNELEQYAPLVTKGQYSIVCDTYIERVPPQAHRPRDWGIGNNPATAVKQYMANSDRFECDVSIDKKVMVSYNDRGYWRCVR